METPTNKNGLFQLLGTAFFVQALMPLIGGLVFKSFESKENISIMTQSNYSVQSR
jgi:hypothetical protein